MASVEAGPSVLVGPIGPLSPAGNVVSPSSSRSYSMVHDSSANPDAGSYGATQLVGPSTSVTQIVGVQKFYLMIGMDASINGKYGVWEVTGSPDYAGAQAASASPAIALPARNISVLG